MQNVQVVLNGSDPTSEFYLKDEEGRFLTVPAADDELVRGPLEPPGRAEEQEADALQQELETFSEENQA